MSPFGLTCQRLSVIAGPEKVNCVTWPSPDPLIEISTFDSFISLLIVWGRSLLQPFILRVSNPIHKAYSVSRSLRYSDCPLIMNTPFNQLPTTPTQKRPPNFKQTLFQVHLRMLRTAFRHERLASTCSLYCRGKTQGQA